jgi:hypothetical protein
MMAKKDEGFLLDRDGNPVQSSSGPVRSGSYNDEKVTQNRIKAAEEKLAQDVQDKLKAKSDSDRVSKDAEESAKAPAAVSVKQPTRPGQGATSAKMPTRPGQGAKPSVVTKEQLAKSGFDNLRDYRNAQKGLKRRDGAAATTAKDKPANQAPATPVNRARYTPADSTPQHYGSPAYMRNLMREDMEKARAEIQPQRREEQGVSKRRKDLADSLSEVGKGFSAVPGGIGGVSNLVKRVKAEPDKYTRPDEASMKKGGSVRGAGIAQRGVRKCKMV